MVKQKRQTNSNLRRNPPINFINPSSPPLFQYKKVKKNLYGFFNNSIGKDISNVRTPINNSRRATAFLPVQSKPIKIPKTKNRLGYTNFAPSKVNIYPTRTKSEQRLIDANPWGDADHDGVPNWFDCRPKDRTQQGFMTKVTKKSLKRYRPQVERIVKKMERRLAPLQSELEEIGEKIQAEKQKIGQKRAQREAERLIQQGVPMSKIREGIPIDINSIPIDPALEKELQKKVAKFQAEFLGYHSALNILREEPNPLRKLLIAKEGNEKKVVGFIYEDPHVLARRKGLMPEVIKEAKRIEDQYKRKQIQDIMFNEMGIPKKDIQVSKKLNLAPYETKIQTGVNIGSDITGKIGELAASRILRKKLSPEEFNSQIELDTVYVIPEERGKGYGKKVIESLMKRPELKKITASGEKEIFERAWEPTGAISKGDYDPSGAIALGRAKGLIHKDEEAQKAEEFKKGHIDWEWVKKEPPRKFSMDATGPRTRMTPEEAKIFGEDIKKYLDQSVKFTKEIPEARAAYDKMKNHYREQGLSEEESDKRIKNIIDAARDVGLFSDKGARLGRVKKNKNTDGPKPIKDSKGNWKLGDLTLEVTTEEKEREKEEKARERAEGIQERMDMVRKLFEEEYPEEDIHEQAINRLKESKEPKESSKGSSGEESSGESSGDFVVRGGNDEEAP